MDEEFDEEGCCSECGYFGNGWRETDVGCDLCGEHLGAICPNCEHVWDLIFNDNIFAAS